MKFIYLKKIKIHLKELCQECERCKSIFKEIVDRKEQKLAAYIRNTNLLCLLIKYRNHFLIQLSTRWI